MGIKQAAAFALAIICQVIFGGFAVGAEKSTGRDAVYFAGLLEEFKGVGKGRFIAGANEEEVLSGVETGGGIEIYYPDRKKKLLEGVSKAEGQVFEKACTFNLKQKPKKYWDVSFRITNKKKVRKGEALLLVFWAKGEKAPQIVDDGIGATLQSYIYTSAVKAHKGRISNFYDMKMLGKEWARYYVKTTPMKRDFEPGTLSFIGMMGHKAQKIDVGGMVWIAFPEGADLSKMPKRDWNYEGRDPNAPWRAEAKKRIEKYRKGELSVKVVDAAGKPMQGAKVRIELQKHAFIFGVAVSMDAFVGKWRGMSAEDIQKYKDVSCKYYNSIVIDNGLKWDYIEYRRKNKWKAAKETLTYYHDRGKHIRGHVLVWPTIFRVPEPLRSKLRANKKLLEPRIIEHIREVVKEFKPWVNDWDVTNETDVCRDFMDNLGPKAMLDWYRIAKESDPKATLTFNEPHFGSEGMEIGSFPQEMLKPDCRGWVEYLIKNNAPLDYLGSQCHGGAVGMEYGGKTGPEGLWKYYDDFYARYGKKLQYTELDITIGDASDPDQVAYQADRLRDTIIIAFAHPAFHSITQWGFWEGAHYRKIAALWNRDWSIRPVGQAYVDLVTKRWWTDDKKVTDDKGMCGTRAFYGTYRVTVEGAGGKKVESTFDFSKGDMTKPVVFKDAK